MLQRDKALLIKLTLFYAIFVIFGSLVPFNVNQLSMADAMQAFSQLKKLDFGIVNRSDWFTNFLLFMPLSYLLLFIIERQKVPFLRVLQLLFICAGLMLLSMGIEFAQLFLNERVSSFKDVIAQLLGMLLSYVVYLFTRVKFIQVVNKLNRYGGKNKWITYANVTLAVLVIYSLMPLDLSISPVEIYNKWQEDRISIIPFASFTFSINEGVFGIVSDIFLWGFIAWLYIQSGKYNAGYILKLCVFYALGIELAQLLVLSRYTDTTDIVSAFIGAAIAIKLFVKQRIYVAPNKAPNEAQNERLNTQPPMSFSLFGQESVLVLWCLMLFFFAVYPFELVQSKAALFSNFQGFFSVPLETYWREGPLQAVTQLLRKVLLVVPLGLLVASILNKYTFAKSHRMIAYLLAIAFLFGLELLQFFIINKVAVASDVALNLLGLYLGIKMYVLHSNKKTTEIHDVKAWQNYKKYYVLLVLFFITVSLYLIHGDERTPYNIKELFNQDFVWLSSALMALSLMVAFALPPIVLDKLIAVKRTSALIMLSATIAHCLLVFNLFYVTFPNESLYDILGYPTWRDQSHYLELGYRFLGFYLPISSAFLLVYSWLTSSQSIAFKSSRLAFTLIYAFLILPLSYFIVVVQAGTDNIIELLPNEGHSFKLLYIVMYCLMLLYMTAWWIKSAYSATLLRITGHAILTLVSAPIGYYLIQHGLQDVIIKYGRVFSGLQFLLSPARDSLLSETQMFFRFCILHFMLLVLFFISGFMSRTISLKHIPLPMLKNTSSDIAGPVSD